MDPGKLRVRKDITKITKTIPLTSGIWGPTYDENKYSKALPYITEVSKRAQAKYFNEETGKHKKY